MKNPTVLVTRPGESAQQFVAGLQAVAGQFEALVAPAFAFEAIPATIPAFDIAVFTSRVGVEHAPEGQGRTAYCVGDTTMQAAQNAGYAAMSAQGKAADLIALILAHQPTERMLHIRGEVAKGDVAATLSAAGLRCDEVVTYRKAVLSPDDTVLDRVRLAKALILPLFSGETVTFLRHWNTDFSSATVIAISGNVARAARALSPRKIVICDHPDWAAMTQATARMIA